MGFGLSCARIWRGIISLLVMWQLTQVILSGMGWYMGDKWEYITGSQLLVLWQLSQDRAVMKWPDGRADAPMPLWHAMQVLGEIPL